MNKRPALLTIFIIILLLNAFVTGAYYVLSFLSMIPVKALGTLTQFAVADFLVVIVPTFIAGHGLWRLKRWGLPFAFLTGGGYLYGTIINLTNAISNSSFNIVSVFSVYFLVFILIFITYLIREQNLFS